MTATASPVLVPGSPEWMRLATASKVPAMLGLSPYESPFSLWHRMAGLIPAIEDSDILRRGLFLEPAIVAWWADQHPEMTVLDSETCYYPQDARFAATLDRIVRDVDFKGRCLEVKSSADRTGEWGRPGTDEIPVDYRVQTVWQMLCTGTTICHVAMLGAYLEFAEYIVHWDQDEADFIRGQVEAFMDSLPDGSKPQRPDIDSHGATYQAVQQLHPAINGSDVELDYDLTVAYCTARTKLAAAQADETHTKSLVADAIGDARRGRYLDQTIAQRQAKGAGTPFLVAGRNLPNFQQETS